MSVVAQTIQSAVLPALKEYYGKQEIKSLTERSSPSLQMIKPEYVDGKTYPVPFKTYDGSGASGSYIVAAADSDATFGTQAPAVFPGTYFATYQIDPLEYQASKDTKGAFINLNIAKMASALNNMRRGLAASLWGYGFGDVGQVAVDAASGDTTIYVGADVAIKLDLYKQIEIFNSQFANLGSKITGGPYTITAIVKDTTTGLYAVTIDALGAAVTKGYWIRVTGGWTTATGSGRQPVGIPQWIPNYADRSGADWNTYIGTSFFGFDRSGFPDRYAGQFYAKGAESIADAILEGVRLARRGGLIGGATVHMNDVDYRKYLIENKANTVVYNELKSASMSNLAINQAAKLGGAGFSTNEVTQIIDDPYVPQGYAYILDMNDWRLLCMTKTAEMQRNVPKDNEPGNDDVYGAGNSPLNFGILMDDWISVEQVETANGLGAIVGVNFFGNFICDKPSAQCVVKIG